MRRFVVCALTLFLIVGLIPEGAQAQAIDNGSWGSCPWTIDEDGRLTIGAGTGDDTAGTCPWESFSWRNDAPFITSVVVEDGVVFPQDCSNLFSGIPMESFAISPLADTSGVSDMSGIFSYCWRLTSLDLGGLDTSSATTMSSMFRFCENLTQIDLSGWDTTLVTDMSDMFEGCTSLTSLDLSSFNTPALQNLGFIFNACTSLTSLDIIGFDTRSVINGDWFAVNPLTALRTISIGANTVLIDQAGDSRRLFAKGDWLYTQTGVMYDASAIESTPIAGTYTYVGASGQWGSCPWTLRDGTLTISAGTGSSTNGEEGDSPWQGYPIGEIVVESNVVFPGNCGFLFGDLTASSYQFGNVDTSNVTNMMGMFRHNAWLTSLDLSQFNTTSVTNMAVMFYDCGSMTSLTGLNTFDTSNVTDMAGMFAFCSSLVSVDLHSFNTSNVRDMSGMFEVCSSLESVDLRGFNTSEVLNMSRMFFFCENFTSLNVTGFNTSKVIDMSDMFQGCVRLTTLDVHSFDTARVEYMSRMFEGCQNLLALDLSSFDTRALLDGVDALYVNEQQWWGSYDPHALGSISFGPDFVYTQDMHMPGNCLWLSMTDNKKYTEAQIAAQRSGVADTYTRVLVGDIVYDFVLPTDLLAIEDEAFRNDESICAVDIPSGCASIGENAFAGCSNLAWIRIPISVVDISADAFDGCAELVILGQTGSAAEAYAIQHGIAFWDNDTSEQGESFEE